MYEIKNPTFFIKFVLLQENELNVNMIRQQFHEKFKGFIFKVETSVWLQPRGIRVIVSFKHQPHRTIVTKMLNWFKRTYKVKDLDVSWS